MVVSKQRNLFKTLFLSQALVSSHHSPKVNIGFAKQNERKTEKQEAIRKKGSPLSDFPLGMLKYVIRMTAIYILSS